MSALDVLWYEFMRNIHKFPVNAAEAQQAVRKCLSGLCAPSREICFLPALEESETQGA